MIETNLPDWMMAKGCLMDPVCIKMMESVNEFSIKYNIKKLRMVVVEDGS